MNTPPPHTRFLAYAAHTVICTLTIMIVSGFQSLTQAAESDTPSVFHPTIRVPELAASPKIDGKLDEAEWAGATMFSGVMGNPLGLPFLLPPEQQVTWAMGFRDGMIYIGMRSHHPKGIYPLGDVKDDDNPDVLWGDHVEIRIATEGRENARTPYFGNYEMIINAWGAMNDRHMFNGTPGTEDFWSTGGEVACHVTDEVWEMEISIKAESLGISELDGRSVVLQLVRADTPLGGLFYAGVVGLHSGAWNRFAEVIFDSPAPAIHFDSLGRPKEGDLEINLKTRIPEGREEQVRAKVSVRNAEGEVIFEENQETTTRPAETLTLKATDMAISEVTMDKGRNVIELTVESLAGGEATLLYQNRFPFVNMTPEWRTTYLDPWLNSRPAAGEWRAEFGYWPYAHRGVASVDVNLFGIDEKIREASEVSVQVRLVDGKNHLGESSASLVEGQARLEVELPELEDGSYLAEFIVKDSAGKTLDQVEVPFERKTFPFERNQLGKSGEVIPPFLPVQVDPAESVLIGAFGRKFPYKPTEKPVVQVWGRAYEFDGSGFFGQIYAVPPSGTAGTVAALLVDPIHLEVGADGKSVKANAGQAEVLESADDAVTVAGSSSAAGLEFLTKATVEYDGWTEYDLTIQPEKDSITVDHVDLVLTLKHSDAGKHLQPVDTLVVQRMGGGLDRSYYGGIPGIAGTVFESTSLGAYGQRGNIAGFAKDWHSFAPITYAGSGDRGLWFFAWSDAGWHLLPDEAMLKVERLADGNVRLRVRLIAGTETLSEPRVLRFAMQAAPIKMNMANYRTPYNQQVRQDTSGYRYYGDSVDSFSLPSDEDYDALRRYLLYGVDRLPNSSPRFSVMGQRFSKTLAERSASNLVLYGSQWMTGAGAPEFSSFAGEWLGANNWSARPDTKFGGLWNYGGTVEWNTPEELSAVVVNWPESMVDFFVYYHDKMIDISGVNGTWWDNYYSGVITNYNKELGRFEQVWNLRMRRELTKRLNVIGWKHMRPPFWVMSDQVEMSWCQAFWLIEGQWGQKAPGRSIFTAYASQDHTAMEFVRAAARTKTSVMIGNPSYPAGFKGTTPEEDVLIRRGVDGMLLSHDIQLPQREDKLLRTLNYYLDYENTEDCLFTGYWALSSAVVSLPDGVKASSYVNARLGAAALVLVNDGEEAVTIPNLLINCEALGLSKEPAATGLLVKDLGDDREIAATASESQVTLSDEIVIPPHDYRLLVIQTKQE